MKVTEESLRNYLARLQKKHLSTFPTISLIVLHKGDRGFSRITGAWGRISRKRVDIQDFMLADKKEAYAALRHEIAHFLHIWTGLEITRYHGKEFRKALKTVSPKTWRTDSHWHETPEILVAMGKALEKVKYIAKCKNCDFERLYKRIPVFVKQNKAICPMCKGHDFTIQKVTV